MTRNYLHKFDRARYLRAWLLAGVPESEVQAEIIQELKGRYGLELVATDAGRKKTRGQVAAAGRRAGLTASQVGIVSSAKGTDGMPAGYPDLIGTLAPRGWSVFLEVKKPGQFIPNGAMLVSPGKPSSEQLAYLDARELDGAIVGVVWSLQDAIAAIGLDRLEGHRAARKVHSRENNA